LKAKITDLEEKRTIMPVEVNPKETSRAAVPVKEFYLLPVTEIKNLRR
jgi:hypothetical protein